MTREQLRRKLMRDNRRAMARVQDLIADGMLSLCVAWYDQQYEELKAKQHPLSDMPPRLLKILEANESL